MTDSEKLCEINEQLTEIRQTANGMINLMLALEYMSQENSSIGDSLRIINDIGLDLTIKLEQLQELTRSEKVTSINDWIGEI